MAEPVPADPADAAHDTIRATACTAFHAEAQGTSPHPLTDPEAPAAAGTQATQPAAQAEQQQQAAVPQAGVMAAPAMAAVTAGQQGVPQAPHSQLHSAHHLQTEPMDEDGRL